MSRIRRHLTYANVMATLAVFIALGGTALASVIITKNSQVGRGTISGHHPPSADHANIIGGSLSGRDLSSGLTSSLKAHCPTGYRLAAHADVCFEFNERPAATYTDALQTCAGSGGHLPTPGELAAAFDNLGVPQNRQWVAEFWFDNTLGFLAGRLEEGSGRDLLLDGEKPDVKTPFRCVSYPSN